MKYVTIFLMIISILIPFSVLAQEKAGPNMVIVEPVFDAGRVDQGTTVAHDFIVRNTGDEALLITQVDTAWGCALADFDPAIAPGGSGKISLAIKTDAYSSPIQKGAKILSNDPDNREALIRIKAHVINFLTVSPPNVYIRKSNDAFTDGVATIATDRKLPLKLEVASFTIPEKVEYTIDEIIKGKTFEIKFHQIRKSGEAYSGLLILKTNYKDKPTLRIRVRSRFD